MSYICRNKTDISIMASIKIKFRPSTVNGKEGSIYFQITHNRVVRQLNTDYKIFPEDILRGSPNTCCRS